MALAAAHVGQGDDQLDPAALNLIRQITGETEPNLRTYLATATVLDRGSNEFKRILEYVNIGQVHQFGLSVDNVIRLRRKNEENFPAQNGTDSEFRMMLWHGTRRQCIRGILQRGFDTPDQRQQMFGLGTYFADRASKSAQYCDRPHAPGYQGHLFLCDVKVGLMYKARSAHHEYRAAPAGYNSVKCCGEQMPDWNLNEEFEGALLPLGPTVPNPRFKKYSTVYNEYTVYRPEQIVLKHLVVVNFHAHPQ